MNALGDEMTETEQCRLIRLETSHRIKNQLNLVYSMLTLSAEDASDDAAKQELQSAADRIHAVAMVHRLLVDQDENGQLEIGLVLEELCRSLADVYPLPIVFDGTAAPMELGSDKALRMAMMVSELVGARYVPGRREESEQRVAVTTRTEQTTLIVTVSHEGTTAEAPKLGRVGKLIVEGFASQIGAIWEQQQDGTTDRTMIRLPTSKR
jgi:two-component sensor histidine kinase